MLKDLLAFPEKFKPTHANMVRDIRLHLFSIRIEIQPRFVNSKRWFQMQNQATNSPSSVCFLPFCILPTPN